MLACNGSDWFAAGVGAGAVAVGFLVWNYRSNLIAIWQKLVAWFKGGEAWALSLEARAKALLDKAAAVRAAVTTAVKS